MSAMNFRAVSQTFLQFLGNGFKTKELDEKVVVSILELPTQHGVAKG